MQRDTGNTESITVEYGFLDSTGDDVNQLKSNWKNYAEAVVRAIIRYLNLTYIPVEGSQYYTVKSGDSLWSISKKFNISVESLKNENGITGTKLTIGEILKIPSKENIDTNQKAYVVKAGDSLYKIARENNTTVNELMKLNNLTSTLLSVGQIIQLPNKKTSEDTYEVKAGDNLYKIARENNTTVNELMKLNNLTSTLLSVGQIINLPNKKTSEDTYVVKAGDSLYKIAKENNTTVNELIKINNLSNTSLSIGQILKLK